MRAWGLVPARDEEASLPLLFDALAAAPPPHLERVLVVDNGSRDRTATVARSHGARVVVEPRAGYGRACLRGIAAIEAAEGVPEAVVFLDADDLLAPPQLGVVLRALEAGADMAVGERRGLPGEGVRLHASLGNRLVTGVLRSAYGSLVRDMGPFRAVRWTCLRALRLDEATYGWYVQMQTRALRAGYRVVGVPVAFRRRVRGRSKVSGSARASVAAGAVMLRTLVREMLTSPPDRRPYPTPVGGPPSRCGRAAADDHV